MKYFSLMLMICVLLLGHTVYSQDGDMEEIKQELYQIKSYYKPGKSKFLLRGYAHAGLSYSEEEFTFEGGSFNPIFLYKQSDRLLFESELEMELEGSELHIGLEYSNISYLLTKSLTIRAGKMLLPFGIYMTNLHPSWIDKFASKPLGLGHEGIIPGADVGFELGGVSNLGSTKLNYGFYVVNGPRLISGDDEPEEAGRLSYGEFPDNNRNKTVGGRLGFIPFSNSMLEIGVSGMYGKAGDEESVYEDVASFLYALDLSFVKNIPAIKSIVDIKAQYSAVQTDNANYVDSEDLTYSFNNESYTFFSQIAIKPAFIRNEVLRRFEVAARYSQLKTPEEALWAIDQDQVELGLNFWLDWRTVFKLTYKIVNDRSDEPGEIEEDGHVDEFFGNAILLHWAIGF